MEKTVIKISEYIKKQTDIVPEIGIMTGKYFNHFVEMVENPVVIKYTDIPDFPTLRADKEGCFIFGKIKNRSIAIVYGRLHGYYGYKQGEILLPMMVLHYLGCRKIISNTSVGALSHRMKVGDVAVITDHINLSGTSPLIGSFSYSNKHRFSNVSDTYSKENIAFAKKIAKSMHFKLKKAVIMQFTGPTQETRAEVNLARMLHADVMGFNIITDTLCASYLGMNYLALVLVTNYNSADSVNTIRYDDIQYNLKCADKFYSEFLSKLVEKF